MNHRHLVHHRGRLSLAQLLILTLAFVLFALGATAAYPAEVPADSVGLLWAKPWSGWRTDLVVTGHATLPTEFQHGCHIGPRPGVSIPANGAAFVQDFGSYQCPSQEPWGVFDVPIASAPGELVIRAEHLATGQTLYVPPSAFKLRTVTELGRAGGLVNTGPDATFVLAWNDGWEGFATASIYGAQGERIGIEMLELLPGMNFIRITTPFQAGSITLKLGYSDGHFAAGGPVTAWATSGPFTNSSAARVVPFVQVVPAD